MLKEFVMKKAMAAQLKNIPEEERNKIIAIVEKNPEFFARLALEIQEKIKGGMTQEEATVAILAANQEEMRKLLGA
jgi:hypothetical protein